MGEIRTAEINTPFGRKLVNALLQFTLVYTMLVDSSLAQTITQYTSDPQGGIGYNRTHWISSTNEILYIFGTSGAGCRGDNSVRHFNPVTKAWRYVQQNAGATVPTVGINNRDNHGSFYIDAIDRLLVWGGSHLEECRGAYYAGVFDPKNGVWTARSTDFSSVAAIIKNVQGLAIDPSMAWAKNSNKGLAFGGSDQGNSSNRTLLVRPNITGGSQPYEMVDVTQSGGPSSRDQVMNNMASDGTDFYVFGGHRQDVINGKVVDVHLADLWRWNSATQNWTQLASAPFTGYQANVTYDSNRHAIVVYASDQNDVARILVYDIKTNTWSNKTPAGLPCRKNQVGAYAPIASLHIYGGGLNCPVENSSNQTLGLQLSDNPPAWGGLDIPLDTWVARLLPTSNSPCSAGYGCKQYQGRTNLQNGRTYFCCGDTQERGQGGWGATYSVDIAKGDWNVEYPACGASDQIQPRNPSENAWAYDSTRNKFYLVSGFIFDTASGAAPCANDPNHIGPPLTFDPPTRNWSRSPFPHPSVVTKGGGASAQTAVYDPITDSVYQPSEWVGGLGMARLNLKTNTWSIAGLACALNSLGNQGSCPQGQTYINSGFTSVDNLFTAIDVSGRVIYFVKGKAGDDPAKLLRYNIDTGAVHALSVMPACCDDALAWDSVNRVLYWWSNVENVDSKLYIYHPDPTGGVNGRWEQNRMFQPEGIQPRGNSILFDPIHNVFMLIGGVDWFQENPRPSFLSYYFLYRYGNGDGRQVPSAPIAPSSLTIRSLNPSP